MVFYNSFHFGQLFFYHTFRMYIYQGFVRLIKIKY